MFGKSAAEENSKPPWNTEQSNKILLILFGALSILIFMDIQARRHYSSGRPPDQLKKAASELRKHGESGIESVKGYIRPAMEKDLIPSVPILRRTAREIFGPAARTIREASKGRLPALNGSRPLHNRSASTHTSISISGPYIRSTATLYFLRFRGRRTQLVSVKRKLHAPANPVGILRLLQKGPSPHEHGILNAFDHSVRILNFRMRGGIAEIDLDAGVERFGKRIVRARIDQIMLSMSQFSEIKSIRLLVNGKPREKIGGLKIRYPDKRKIVAYKTN